MKDLKDILSNSIPVYIYLCISDVIIGEISLIYDAIKNGSSGGKYQGAAARIILDKRNTDKLFNRSFPSVASQLVPFDILIKQDKHESKIIECWFYKMYGAITYDDFIIIDETKWLAEDYYGEHLQF